MRVDDGLKLGPAGVSRARRVVQVLLEQEGALGDDDGHLKQLGVILEDLRGRVAEEGEQGRSTRSVTSIPSLRLAATYCPSRPTKLSEYFLFVIA